MNIQIEFQSIAAGEKNGDFVLHEELVGGTLVLLADGMGGLSFPEQAAKTVCEAVRYYFVNNEVSNPLDLIRRSIEYADNVLGELCYQKKSKMGAALTLMYITNMQLYYTSLGDVRLYHKSIDGTITQLTTDDVVCIENEYYLTVCINGKGFRNPIEVQNIPVKIGDVFLLCSDGFYKCHHINAYLQNKELPPLQHRKDDCSIIKVDIR